MSDREVSLKYSTELRIIFFLIYHIDTSGEKQKYKKIKQADTGLWDVIRVTFKVSVEQMFINKIQGHTCTVTWKTKLG